MKSYKHIAQLASTILYHKRLYYKGKSIISNEEYDALEDKLRQLQPDHPVLNFVGYDLTHHKSKLHHTIPMLSLAKTYSTKELLEFLQRHECVAIDKFDGMALSLHYNDMGNLEHAVTRGNGSYGENVTEQIYHILEIPKTLTLPKALKHHQIEIRGEIYFPLSEFDKYSDLFDSFRNAVPGTLGRKDVNEAAEILKSFLFCPFDIIVYNNVKQPLSATELADLCHIKALYSEKFLFIQTLGFHLHENFVYKLDQSDLNQIKLTEILNKLFDKKRDHQIDGIVFRIEDENVWEEMGATAHHPRGTLAFKRAGETANTKILAIEPNVGRSGKISFRAKLDPVFLSNAKISYATLHNAEFIEKGHYAVGAEVKIIRSGEVIPAILARIDDGQNQYSLPKSCLCGSPLIRKGPDLWCSLKGSCEYSDQESLVHFVSNMNILGVSEKIVYKLHAAGLLKEPANLYEISLDDLLQLEGIGAKSAPNIINAIHANKKVPLWQFLTALGIKGGGQVKCKELAKIFHTLNNILNLTENDLSDLKGWAEKSAKDFVHSLKAKSKMIEHLLDHLTILNDTSSAVLNTNSFFYNKNVCITGTLSKPRSEIKKILEAQGAKVVSAVSAKTDFLICNEASSSSKYKDAEKLNIPILTEEEVYEKIESSS